MRYPFENQFYFVRKQQTVNKEFKTCSKDSIDDLWKTENSGFYCALVFRRLLVP